MQHITARPGILVSGSRAASALAPRASVLDTLGIFADVFFPTLAKGVIMRRPRVLKMAEALDLDRRAIRRMQRLRHKYGAGPVFIRLPGRSLALVLDPSHVHRILASTPEPFATSTPEKRAALAHFEPKNALLSEGRERVHRRQFNEEALQPEHAMHSMAATFLEVVASEARDLRRVWRQSGMLTWDQFSMTWFRIVLRVVFGNAAREDNDLSATMAQLRSAANWAFLRPQRRDLRDKLLGRIRLYLAAAEPGSLAGAVATLHPASDAAPEHQVPQWLFAFDPAGIATFRSLALLASHPEQAAQAREEAAGHASSGRNDLPFLRATALESLRLWPTSPLILRETKAETFWDEGLVPANTGLIIFAPFFHRDGERLAYADRFTPELWLDPDKAGDWPLIPFSEGPAVCPGRSLVLLLSTAMLAALLEDGRPRFATSARLRKSGPLPATLNHFGLRFVFDR